MQKRGSKEGRRRQAEGARRTHTKHGMRNSPEYRSWRSMKQRCLDKNDPYFHQYGGRGITICKEWIDSFEAFYAYMGPRPTGQTLDRIRSEGNYEPGNVQWSSHTQQQRNRTNNRLLTWRGRTMAMSAWAEELGMSKNTLVTRLNKLGWPLERALSEPVR